MSEFADYLAHLFQLDSVLGIVVLVALITMLIVTAYSLNSRKQIASNGKVIATRKLSLMFKRTLPTADNKRKKHKPFTRHQQRILRILYSGHGALFGLIIFVFGLAMVSRVYFDLANGKQQILDPIMITFALLGSLAMPAGVLLIYFRNSGNPFDEG